MKSNSEVKRQPTEAEQNFAMEAVKRMFDIMASGDSFKATPRSELTQDETAIFTADLHKILQEANVAAEKHDLFIKQVIEGINDVIRKMNELTVENFDNELSQTKNPSLTKDALLDLGLDENSPEYLKISDRIISLPITKSVINYLFDKGMEVGMAKEKLEHEKELARDREMMEAFSALTAQWNQKGLFSTEASNDSENDTDKQRKPSP